ncbi:hypothetical protein ND748_15630 [Frankia sp. AiPs1]|uniref:hypothetical protein n=1 Tax=Frankia sp. AiPs1 TaxID=573493 RepID=UPI00204482CA|nr:hypothetical protein [Frankia sp. AiPs1]MCM3923088.1 hypothetical protein [Frankia sp. AiPs1]
MRSLRDIMVDVTDDALSAFGLRPPAEAEADRLSATFAYLVQVSSDGGRWMADRTEPSGGFEHSPGTAAQVARQVLHRRFVQLRADEDARWRDLWFRADVWSLDQPAGPDRADPDRADPDGADRPGPPAVLAGWALSGRHLQTRGITPDAVEVRTPAQVRREVGR